MKLFDQLDALIPSLHGWCSIEKAKALSATVLALRNPVSVDLGVWGGRTCFAMALAHKQIGQGQVWAVDPWAKSASAEGQTAEHAKWWGEVADHEAIYIDFLRHIGSTGTLDIVKVCRSKSDDVEPPQAIGVLSLDGNHGPQAIKDAERWGSKVVKGGFCFADDIQWPGGNVVKAVAKLEAMGFKELYKLDGGAVYQRI